jgi:hypothetical protein
MPLPQLLLSFGGTALGEPPPQRFRKVFPVIAPV